MGGGSDEAEEVEAEKEEVDVEKEEGTTATVVSDGVDEDNGGTTSINESVDNCCSFATVVVDDDNDDGASIPIVVSADGNAADDNGTGNVRKASCISFVNEPNAFGYCTVVHTGIFSNRQIWIRSTHVCTS